jgi:LuxR family maltose regulon positive regulatory protein
LAALVRVRPPFPGVPGTINLTGRERAMLLALAKGGNRFDIADAMHVSHNTVKSQLASLYRKLGTTTRAETLKKAAAEGLLTSAPHGAERAARKARG